MVGSGSGSCWLVSWPYFGWLYKDAGVDVMLLVRSLTIYSIIGRGKLKLTVATTTSCNNSFGLAGVHALW